MKKLLVPALLLIGTASAFAKGKCDVEVLYFPTDAQGNYILDENGKETSYPVVPEGTSSVYAEEKISKEYPYCVTRGLAYFKLARTKICKSQPYKGKWLWLHVVFVGHLADPSTQVDQSETWTQFHCGN
jgi:hypothetical protein